MTKIEITIEASVKTNDWLRVATKKARTEATRLGIEWKAADVFVTLPEAGRCMTKAPGFENLVAHG